MAAKTDGYGVSFDASLACRITLNDSELIAVQEALGHYRKFCKAKLADGPQAPYWAYLRAIDAVLGRLFADTQMTSTSSFCWPKDPGRKGITLSRHRAIA
jgi:hypothetical protein